MGLRIRMKTNSLERKTFHPDFTRIGLWGISNIESFKFLRKKSLLYLSWVSSGSRLFFSCAEGFGCVIPGAFGPFSKRSKS